MSKIRFVTKLIWTKIEFKEALHTLKGMNWYVSIDTFVSIQDRYQHAAILSDRMYHKYHNIKLLKISKVLKLSIAWKVSLVWELSKVSLLLLSIVCKKFQNIKRIGLNIHLIISKISSFFCGYFFIT